MHDPWRWTQGSRFRKDTTLSGNDGAAHEVYYKGRMKKLGINPEDNISLPQLSQFRVYFASELHNRGVSDITIAKMLNHHDDKMLGYYGRESNEVQENIFFYKNIINYVLEDTYKILGTRSEQYMEQIYLIYQSYTMSTLVMHIQLVYFH